MTKATHSSGSCRPASLTILTVLRSRCCALLLAAGALCLLSLVSGTARAQDSFDSIGAHQAMSPDPNELGFVDSSNGALHLEIPLVTLPQRGGPPLPFRLVYDSTIWSQVGPYGPVWTPWYEWDITTQPGGWQVLPDMSFMGQVKYSISGVNGAACVAPYGNYCNYSWSDGGNVYSFPIGIKAPTGNNCSGATSGDAFAADSSGYHMYVGWIMSDNFCTQYQKVYAPDGTLVYQSNPAPTSNDGTMEDTNGNYLTSTSISSSTGYDTVGRPFGTLAAGNFDGQQFANTSMFPNIQVPTSQGSSSYTITSATIPVSTNFGQSGVGECTTGCEIPVIQSLNLPDGTSYQFKYDCDENTGIAACGSPTGQNAYYGMLTSVTLPTGGTITYTYTNFTDPYKNVSRWLSSRTSADGTWTYTPLVITKCTSSPTGCVIQVTATKPDGASTVTRYTENNGQWPTQAQSFDTNGTLLSTTTETWDFSQSSPMSPYVGAGYIRKTAEIVAVPVPGGSIAKQTKYTYDSPQQGNITSIQDWGFYPASIFNFGGTVSINTNFPSNPNRTTNTTYLTTGTNNINRPTSVTLLNSAGSKVSQTLTTYDSYGGCPGGLASVTGMYNHDDTNFGTGNTARGNPTQTQTWVSGSSYLTSQFCYDTTGQVTQETDSAGNTIRYGYADSFYTDNGSNPPTPYTPSQPTNAYVTSATPPIIGTTTTGYYYGSGNRAISVDVNGATTYSHYLDPFDRNTENISPIGWNLTNYTSAKEVDTYTAVGDASPSTSCSSCKHVQTIYDSWGRKTSEALANNPGGAINVTTSYDEDGRVQSVSHPSVGTPAAYESYTYDGSDRTIQVTHPDNQSVQALYGPLVSSTGAGGGLSSQQGSTSTYGYGYSELFIDEAGKQRQEWKDGFGRVIEVDELSTTGGGGTPGTGSASTSGTEQVTSGGPTPGTGNVYITGYDQTYQFYNPDCDGQGDGCYQQGYDQGTISITVNRFTGTYNYGQYINSYGVGDTPATVASGLASALNVSSSPVTAEAYGNGEVTLKSKATGAAANYTLSVSTTYDTTDFSSPSFTLTPSGAALTGGANSSPVVYDSGTIWVTVNGFQASVAYGQSSTASSLASAIANGFNTTSGSPVTASVSGTTISLTATAPGVISNYTLGSGSSTNAPQSFATPSFSVSVSGDALTGGADSSGGSSSPVVTLYTYDAANRLTQVVQGAQTRTFVYDGLGRVTQETTPEAGTEAVSFTGPGGGLCSGDPSRPCSRTDARGITITYTYDALNRITRKTYSNGQGGVSYTYDQGGAGAFALGRLTQMTDPSGSETYTYNKMRWITQFLKTVNGTSYAVNYQYNTSGELTQITYPSGRVVQQSYNPIGLLCEVAPQTVQCGTATSPYATGYAYNAAGQVTAFSYGNGVAASFGYSPNRSQLTSLSYAKGGQPLFSLSYLYQFDPNNCTNGVAGNNGQIQCIADVSAETGAAGRSASYTYDTVGRLSTAATVGSTNYPQWGLSETYDRYGNRWAQTVMAGTAPMVSLSYNAATNQPNGYTYDASGNMTVEPLGPPNYYTYDAENRLTNFSGNGGNATYTYDGGGLRVQKSANGTTTVSIFSGSDVIAEYDNGATPASPSREYIYGGGQMLAMISGGTINYYHQDHLSVRLITDANGNEIGEQGHFPFGESWYQSNTTAKWVFTTYQRDSETGLDYAMARFYDSRVASFCSADPIRGTPDDPQSWNRYSYARNNPVNITDPSGEFWGSFFKFLSVGLVDFLPIPNDAKIGIRIAVGLLSGFLAPADAADSGSYATAPSSAAPAATAGPAAVEGSSAQVFVPVPGTPAYTDMTTPTPMIMSQSAGKFVNISTGWNSTGWNWSFIGPFAGAATQALAPKKQQECAKKVVNKLFDTTQLSNLTSPTNVSVGSGNWISFATTKAVSPSSLFSLTLKGASTASFYADPEAAWHSALGARSNTTPSLHFPQIEQWGTFDPSEPIQLSGHVDASNMLTDPGGHMNEARTGTTTTPCDLLKGMP